MFSFDVGVFVVGARDNFQNSPIRGPALKASHTACLGTSTHQHHASQALVHIFAAVRRDSYFSARAQAWCFKVGRTTKVTVYFLATNNEERRDSNAFAAQKTEPSPGACLGTTRVQ